MTFQILCIDTHAIPGAITINHDTVAIEIGRDPHCDIRLMDDSSSRFHARLFVEPVESTDAPDRKHTQQPYRLCIVDNNSSNGTWVADTRLSGKTAQQLTHNVQFRCGDTRFVCIDSDANSNDTQMHTDTGQAIAISKILTTRSWQPGDDPKQLALIHHICRDLARSSADKRPGILAAAVDKIIDSSHVAIYMHGVIRAGTLSPRVAQRLASNNQAQLYILGRDLHGQTVADESIGSALSVPLHTGNAHTHNVHSHIIAVRHIARDPFTDRELHLLSHLAHDAGDYFRHGQKKIDLIGSSPQMEQLRQRITRIASSDTTVLVTGESGTGKEIIAQSIHQLSGRHLGPMISVNCAAISGSLFEAELFGHEKGAFTGADSAREGKIRAAHGGTLFLDEVGEMSLEAQAKLLRVLQDHRVQAVGAEHDILVDVRIIAATNRNLQDMVHAHTFREDLLYRLDVLRIHTAALNAHKQDIPEIALFLLRRISNQERRPCPRIDRTVLLALCQHDWHGNVRQLENTLRRALVFADDCIYTEHLELNSDTGTANSDSDGNSNSNNGNGKNNSLDNFQSLAQLEAAHISTALTLCAGNKSQAAKLLGISRPTIHKKIGDYGIQ